MSWAPALVLAFLAPLAGGVQPFGLVVDAPPELAAAAARIESIRPESLGGSLAHAGLELPSRVTVTVIPEDDPRARATPRWIAGFASGTDRITVFPQRAGRYPYGSLESLVLHEIVHLSLNVRAKGNALPRWFHEGVATSVESGWSIGNQVRLLVAAAREPRLDDVDALFASGRAPETSTAYLLSAALVEDIRRRHAADVPGSIAARVAAGASFDEAFEGATGETVDEAVVRAWRVYRGVRWLPMLTATPAMWAGILALAVVAFVVRLRRRRHKRWEEDDGPDDADNEDATVGDSSS